MSSLQDWERIKFYQVTWSVVFVKAAPANEFNRTEAGRCTPLLQ